VSAAAAIPPEQALPRFHGIRAVAFDLDGTLVDSVPDIHAAVNRVRAEEGLGELPRALVTDLVGRGSEDLIRRALGRDLPAAEVEARFDACLARYLEHYRALNGTLSVLYPGVEDGLARLRERGLRLACITNKWQELALDLLERRGLRGYFEVVYGGDALPARKPDPLPLLQVCADFALAPAALLMIGDSSNDARAARAAGCPVLVVPYGYNHGEPVQSIDADGIVPTLRHAVDLIV